mmetsp:Transcript_13771/g.39167  ORF Transcript_13771/g.39167 Transcript_13771/m.39167 type:complete len:287 (-) Transcript_13771:1566-2426(-)
MIGSGSSRNHCLRSAAMSKESYDDRSTSGLSFSHRSYMPFIWTRYLVSPAIRKMPSSLAASLRTSSDKVPHTMRGMGVLSCFTTSATGRPKHTRLALARVSSLSNQYIFSAGDLQQNTSSSRVSLPVSTLRRNVQSGGYLGSPTLTLSSSFTWQNMIVPESSATRDLSTFSFSRRRHTTRRSLKIMRWFSCDFHLSFSLSCVICVMPPSATKLRSSLGSQLYFAVSTAMMESSLRCTSFMRRLSLDFTLFSSTLACSAVILSSPRCSAVASVADWVSPITSCRNRA